MAPAGSQRQRAESVADAVLRDQALAIARAELAPEAAHVHVHGAAVPRHGAAIVTKITMPDLADQIGPGEHRVRMRAEEGQQLELLEGQLDPVPVSPDTALGLVQVKGWQRSFQPSMKVSMAASSAPRRRPPSRRSVRLILTKSTF